VSVAVRHFTIILSVAASEMRPTFFQIGLLNDTFTKHVTSFILYRKEWGVSNTEGERERERTGGE
jgi:hypothetical protein